MSLERRVALMTALGFGLGGLSVSLIQSQELSPAWSVLGALLAWGLGFTVGKRI